LNNTFLNNHVTEGIKREIKKFLETNDNENTTQNRWDAARAVLRGKFTAIQPYLKKQEKYRIDNLTFHLKQLEKEQKPPKIRRKEPAFLQFFIFIFILIKIKNQILVLLTITIVSFISFSFISAQIFIISFLLILGGFCSFSSCFR